MYIKRQKIDGNTVSAVVYRVQHQALNPKVVGWNSTRGACFFFFFVANNLKSRVLHTKKRERDQRILLCLRRHSSSLAFLSMFINNEIASVLTASRPEACRNRVPGKSISFDTPYTLESRLWVKNKIPFAAARRSDADYQS